LAASARSKSIAIPSPRAASATLPAIEAAPGPNFSFSASMRGRAVAGAAGSSWYGRYTTSTSPAPGNAASALSNRRFPM
jgi:hypothetical protein